MTPLPRRLHAKALGNLDAAEAIVYDITFNGRTSPDDDLALIDAIEETGDRLILATASRIEGTERPAITWGADHVLDSGARIGMAVVEPDPNGDRRYVRTQIAGIPTLSVEVAAALGFEVPEAPTDGFPIDYAGPKGTYPTIPFSRILNGSFDPEDVRGRIVVVAYTHSVFQDPLRWGCGRHLQRRVRRSRSPFGVRRSA